MLLKGAYCVGEHFVDPQRAVKPVKPSSKIFLLTVPRRCLFCRSSMLFLSCFCYAFVRVCLLMPCGHLLGKG